MPAERLEDKEPLAASLLYHRMIDFTSITAARNATAKPPARAAGRASALR